MSVTEVALLFLEIFKDVEIHYALSPPRLVEPRAFEFEEGAFLNDFQSLLNSACMPIKDYLNSLGKKNEEE